jgi:hypothetical protein
MYELVVEDNSSVWTYVGDLDKIANDYAKKRNHNSEIFIELYQYINAYMKERKERVEENVWINFCMLVNKYKRMIAIKEAGKDYDC